MVIRKQKLKEINFENKCNKRSLKNNSSPVIPGSLDPLFNVECQVPQILKGSSDISRKSVIKRDVIHNENRRAKINTRIFLYNISSLQSTVLEIMMDTKETMRCTCLSEGYFHLGFTKRFFFQCGRENKDPQRCP